MLRVKLKTRDETETGKMKQPRCAAPTIKFIDEYCQWYKSLFSDVRSFEAFKYLHIGCISDIKRKTLPAIAKIVGLDNHQGLHHLNTIPATLDLAKSLKNFSQTITQPMSLSDISQWDGRTVREREQKIRQAALILAGECIAKLLENLSKSPEAMKTGKNAQSDV
jgi:hypothetical protein